VESDVAIPTSVTLDTPRKSGLLKRLISAVVLLPVFLLMRETAPRLTGAGQAQQTM